jgi:hypothetical protein
MTPREAVAVEITQPPTFSSVERRRAHARKHILGLGAQRDERWESVFGKTALREAVEELRQGRATLRASAGPDGEGAEEVREGAGESALRRVEEAYERLLGDLVQRACAERREHEHQLDFRFDETFEEVVEYQSVVAWPTRERIFIVASAPERYRSFGAYVLRTGFRPLPLLGSEKFARKVREWMRGRRWRARVLETHDDPADAERS